MTEVQFNPAFILQSSKSVIQTDKARTLNALLNPIAQYYDEVLCIAQMP